MRDDSDRGRQTRRVNRLRDELIDEIALDLGDDALTELDYAMRPPVHEGRMPSYGAVVARSITGGQQVLPVGRVTGTPFVHGGQVDSTTMRMLADGYSAFMWRDAADARVLLGPFAPNASSVAQFAADTGTAVVRRSVSGVVTVTAQRSSGCRP